MTGKLLIEVTNHIHAEPMNGDARRGARDPLLRTSTVAGGGFRFGLSMVVGALGATVATGRDEDADGPWELPRGEHQERDAPATDCALGSGDT